MIGLAELKYSLDNINSWIRDLDQKTGIFLSAQTITLTIIFNIYMIHAPEKNLPSISIFVLKYFGICLIATSMLMNITNIRSSIIHKKTKNPLLFYGDISHLSLKQFIKDVSKTSSFEFSGMLKAQIFFSSRIATTKHKVFKSSIDIFFTGLVLIMASVAIQSL